MIFLFIFEIYSLKIVLKVRTSYLDVSKIIEKINQNLNLYFTIENFIIKIL